MEKLDKCELPHNVLSLYLTSSAKTVESEIWSTVEYITLPSEFVPDVLDDDDLCALLDVYAIMYPELPRLEDHKCPRLIKRYKSLRVGQEKFGSRADSHSNRSARILARWLTSDGGVSLSEDVLRPGLVANYISHSILLNGTLTVHLFAIVRWHKKAHSTSNLRELWLDTQFESGGASAFLPVQRIHSRLAAGYVKTSVNRYFEVCPLPRMIIA